MSGLKRVRLVGMVLAVVMLLTGSAFAAGGTVFDDVKSGAWYEKSIAEMKAKGIVQGTGESTFAPDSDVTVQQSIVFLGRLLEWEKEDTAVPVTFVNRSRLADWAKGYMTAAIRNDVVAGADLYVEPKAAAKRYEIAIFAVKALGMDTEARGRSGAVLSYNDAGDIPERAVGYIAVAAEEGILTGNLDGTFKPEDSITRAQMAAVLARLEEKLDSERGNVVKGEVFGFSVSDGTITIRKADSKLAQYELAADALVYDDDNSIGLNGLSALDAVALALDEDSDKVLYAEVIDEFEVQPTEFSVEGEITAVDTDAPSLTIKKDDDTEVSYDLADDAELRLDYQDAGLEDLVAGQYVEVAVKDELITQVMAESFEETVEGIVVKVEFGADTKIIVTLEDDDEEISYVIDDDVDIDGDASGLRDIFAGQEVELELTNNRVINIDVTSLEDEVEGTITKLILAADSEVVINVDGVERTLGFAPAATIEKDDNSLEVSDLRIGDYVEADITGNVITYMDVTAKIVTDYRIGEIENVNTDAEVIILKDSNKPPIYLNDETIILKFGEEESLRRLDAGDEIIAVGIIKSGILEANTIVVLAATK